MTDPTGAQSGTDDTSAQSGTTGETGQQQGSNAGDSAGTGTDSSATAQSGEASAQTVARADFERLQNQLRVADQKREAAQQELRQLRDKDLPEMDKLKRDLDEAKALNETLSKAMREQAIDTAFYGSTKHTWHDPKAARRLLDMEGVDVAEDRTVTGMESAIEKLAKSNPWMLKPADGAPAGGAGAPPMNGRTNTTNENKDKTATLKRFPALRTRQS